MSSILDSTALAPLHSGLQLTVRNPGLILACAGARAAAGLLCLASLTPLLAPAVGLALEFQSGAMSTEELVEVAATDLAESMLPWLGVTA